MATPEETLNHIEARIDSYDPIPWRQPPTNLLAAYGNLAAAIELNNVGRELLQMHRIMSDWDID